MVKYGVPAGRQDKKIDTTLTDIFGDFKFDNLEEKSGKYKLEIVSKGYEKKVLEIELKTNVNVGTIYL